MAHQEILNQGDDSESLAHRFNPEDPRPLVPRFAVVAKLRGRGNTVFHEKQKLWDVAKAAHEAWQTDPTPDKKENRDVAARAYEQYVLQCEKAYLRLAEHHRSQLSETLGASNDQKPE